NLTRLRFDPVEQFHRRLLVRSSDAQATKIPVKLACTRMDHAFEELRNVFDFKRKVYTIHSLRHECCVMNLRRERVHNGQTNQSANHRFFVDLVDVVKRSEIAGVNLARRRRALVVAGAVRQKRSTRWTEYSGSDSRVTHRDRDQAALLAGMVEQSKYGDAVNDVVSLHGDLHHRCRRTRESLVDLLQI